MEEEGEEAQGGTADDESQSGSEPGCDTSEADSSVESMASDERECVIDESTHSHFFRFAEGCLETPQNHSDMLPACFHPQHCRRTQQHAVSSTADEAV